MGKIAFLLVVLICSLAFVFRVNASGTISTQYQYFPLYAYGTLINFADAPITFNTAPYTLGDGYWHFDDIALSVTGGNLTVTQLTSNTLYFSIAAFSPSVPATVNIATGRGEPTHYTLTFSYSANLISLSTGTGTVALDWIPLTGTGGGITVPPTQTYFYLTISLDGIGGTTNPPVGSYSYVAGVSVSFTASANPGFSFAVWKVDGVNYGSAFQTVVMNGNHTAVAVFQPIGQSQPKNPSPFHIDPILVIFGLFCIMVAVVALVAMPRRRGR